MQGWVVGGREEKEVMLGAAESGMEVEKDSGVRGKRQELRPGFDLWIK